MSAENWQLVGDVFTKIINTTNDLDFDTFLSQLEPCNKVEIEDGLLSVEDSALLMKNLTLAVVVYYLKLRGVLDADFLQYAGENMRIYATGNRAKTQEGYLCRRVVGFCDALDLQYGQELRLRIISKGIDGNLDTVEHMFMKIEYGAEPLLKLSSDGSPVCEVRLNELETGLRTSIGELLEAVREMASDLPRLSPSNQPIMYVGMRKTSWAPEDYIAPYYPNYTYLRPALRHPGELLRCWTAYDVIREKLKAHAGVNTGYHCLKTSLIHKQGNFGSSELFIKSYAGAAARSLRY